MDQGHGDPPSFEEVYKMRMFVRRISERKAAAYMLAGFRMALEKVKSYSYTEQRISMLFVDLDVIEKELEKLASEKSKENKNGK